MYYNNNRRGRGNNNNYNNRGNRNNYSKYNNNRGRRGGYNNNNYNNYNNNNYNNNNNHYSNFKHKNNKKNYNNLFGKYIISQDYDTIDIDNDLKIIIVKGNNNKIYCAQKVKKLIIKGCNNKFILEDEGKLYYAYMSGAGNEIKCKNYTRIKSTIKGINNIIITKQKDYYDDESDSDSDESDSDDSDLDDYDLDEDDLEFLKLRKNIRKNKLLVQGGYYNCNNNFNLNNKKVNVSELKSFNYSMLLPLFKEHNKKCQICLIKFRENEIIKLFSCNQHIFHINCIKLWLEKKANCPLC